MLIFSKGYTLSLWAYNVFFDPNKVRGVSGSTSALGAGDKGSNPFEPNWGYSQVGKAMGFGPITRRFDPYYPLLVGV